MSLEALLYPEEQTPLTLSVSQIQRMSQNLSSEQKKELFSVIESNEEHHDANPFIEKIQKENKDVLYDVKLDKDIDPALRGPFGVAHIDLQDGAVPQKGKPFRMLGEKEQALRKLIEKFLEREWIEPTESEWAQWGSQAF